MEEINYKIKYKANSLQQYLETASRNCRARFKYYMNAELTASSDADAVRASMETTSLKSAMNSPNARNRGRNL